MAGYRSVVFTDRFGEPLIAEWLPDEPEPYRRTLMGFTAERGTDGQVDWRSDVRPPNHIHHGEDAEGIELEVEEEGGEEGCTCQ